MILELIKHKYGKEVTSPYAPLARDGLQSLHVGLYWVFYARTRRLTRRLAGQMAEVFGFEAQVIIDTAVRQGIRLAFEVKS